MLQVHPLIAQRWTGRLRKNDKGGKLQMVMCANEGYLPGRVNFAARSAAAGGGAKVDLIQMLKSAVEESGVEGLREMLGEDMARYGGGGWGEGFSCGGGGGAGYHAGG